MKHLFYFLFIGITVFLLSACKDDWNEELPWARPVVEGIPGELELSVLSGDFSEHRVSTRGTEITTEQHVHSAYIFVIDMNNDKKGPEHCKILSRRYFYDMTDSATMVTEGNESFRVNELKIPAFSCNKAAVFAIINLGYSNVQGVANDVELLEQCDTVSTLQGLKRLSASLVTLDKEENNGLKEVNVERMQGHHLMSGFLSSLAKHDYTLGSQSLFVLEAVEKGKIKIRDFHFQNQVCRPLGSVGSGIPVAIFAHRLDVKITVNIEPDGDLKTIPGAYFQLKSWRVINAPVSENIFWKGERTKKEEFAVSKLFRRDINPTTTGGWTFTYYQFENYDVRKFDESIEYEGIGTNTIANAYNEEYGLKGENRIKPIDIEYAFYDENGLVYPNKFTTFAYTLRELENKRQEDGTDYDPNNSENQNDKISVENTGYVYAPKNSTYLLLTGKYYNPQEPVKRRKDRDNHPEISFETYPYLNEMQQPVRTKEEAAKRMRSATVVYRIHLGYVGSGNYEMNAESIKPNISDFADYKKKLNDYNVLRNHHYIYTIKVAGVENIKLEATRENGGNILEQEQQPGAEGLVMESQHLYECDSHYEARNLVIDFARMPESYDDGFAFGVLTPYEKMRITMKIKETGDIGFIDKDGVEVEGIRGHDLDWVHFAWHGTPEMPGRSLIDENDNGIAYSKTYGGYVDQQTYLDKDKHLLHDKDSDHPYRLLNVTEFSKLVWVYFNKWKKLGKPSYMQKLYFTFYVDEFYYDFNPVTGAKTDWTEFCNQPRRELVFFMEKEEHSADNESWYADAHVVIYQNAIQTLYATKAWQGQIVPDVAFGIEGVDEFQAKYSCGNYNDHYFSGTTDDNGLYNTMEWYKTGHTIPWIEAEKYYSEKARKRVLKDQDFIKPCNIEGRNNRRGQWAVYARNRDLNRNNRLDPDEVRWFVPAIDQYTLCFLGGRPVFENPLFEKEKAIILRGGMSGADWVKGIPLAHYMSSSSAEHSQIFWAEEGCSKGRYNAASKEVVYGIRMARMLTPAGRVSTGMVFVDNTTNSEFLKQDQLYILSRTKNGAPVPYEDRVDGYNYYITLNKMNPEAFRDYIEVSELGHHMHEQKQNWLYREYVIAKNRVGYSSYTNSLDNNPYPLKNGIPRTWWQMCGVWTDGPEGIKNELIDVYRYHGPEHTLAYNYYENHAGTDLHHWRVPNLREAAIMSMSFPVKWFGYNPGGKEASIVSLTKSDNLGPQSTNIPYWNIKSNFIKRIPKDVDNHDNVDPVVFYMRPVHDVH